VLVHHLLILASDAGEHIDPVPIRQQEQEALYRF